MRDQKKEIIKSVVRVRYTTEITCFQQVNFNFDPVEIDLLSLDSEQYKGIKLLRIKKSDEINSRPSYIMVEAEFEYEIRQNSKKYKDISQYLENDGIIRHTHFDIIFNDERKRYDRIINDLIYYLSCWEGLSFSSN